MVNAGPRRVILAGGRGQLGTLLAKHFHAQGAAVGVLGRQSGGLLGASSNGTAQAMAPGLANSMAQTCLSISPGAA